MKDPTITEMMLGDGAFDAIDPDEKVCGGCGYLESDCECGEDMLEDDR